MAIAAKAITPKIFVPILLLFLGIYHFIINCGSFAQYHFPDRVISYPFVVYSKFTTFAVTSFFISY